MNVDSFAFGSPTRVLALDAQLCAAPAEPPSCSANHRTAGGGAPACDSTLSPELGSPATGLAAGDAWDVHVRRAVLAFQHRRRVATGSRIIFKRNYHLLMDALRGPLYILRRKSLLARTMIIFVLNLREPPPAPRPPSRYSYFILTDNCHQFCSYTLNSMNYRNRHRWNMVELAVLVFVSGRFTSPAAAARTLGPFALIFVAGIVFGGLTFLKASLWAKKQSLREEKELSLLIII